MAFWKNVLTLGGAHFLDKARQRYADDLAAHERVAARLTLVNATIERTIARLRRSFKRTKRTLRHADAMLGPACMAGSERNHAFVDRRSKIETNSLAKRSASTIGASSTQRALMGVSAGTTAAIVAWQGVQVLGTASTGTAIGGIYGAAASNAGWAAFGGGSLATGGGGMALGHLVLPGVGLLVGVGFGAYSTYSKAIEIEKLCKEIERATDQNETTLALVDKQAEKLNRAESSYIWQTQSYVTL